MKRTMQLSILAVLLLAMATSTTALAQGGYHHGGYHHGTRVSVGFVFGGPAYWGYPGYYYPPPYYYPYYPYYPPVVTVPAQPTVYTERGDSYAPPEQSPGYYWYYCAESNAYYPYVKQCAGRWQRVTPQPPGG